MTTRWAPDRIPVVCPPAAGEGLDSWLENYARRLRVCSHDLLDHLGLTDSTLARMVTVLTCGERDVLTTATGIDAAMLTAMTLQPFDAVAVTIDPVRRTVVHPPAWRRQAGSRYCPACLHDTGGRWQLAWRLPWAFACTTHARLLGDVCPACGRRPVGHRPGARTTASLAGGCAAPAPTGSRGWGTPACGHPLSDVEAVALPTDGLILRAQRHVDRLLAAATATVDPHRRGLLRRTLTELHILSRRALAALHTNPGEAPDLVHAVLGEGGGTVPAQRGALDSSDAHRVAVGTAIAVAAHRPDATGRALLAWLLHLDQHRRPSEPHQVLRPFRDAGPHLTGRVLTILDPTLKTPHRLAYATTSRHPRRPALTAEQLHQRLARLPALLWPAWSIRLLPATMHAAPAPAQAALAAMTLLPGSRLSGPQAAALLGNHHARSHIAAVVTALPADQQTAVLAILTDLAHALDARPAPIDYTRRRALFRPADTRADRRAYSMLATARQWRPPSPLQLRLLDAHLAALLTGTRPDDDDAGERARPVKGIATFNPLTIALPRPVRDFVHEQARRLLRRHDVVEPLTWHPPPPVDAPWPGIDPCAVDARQVARAVAQHATDRIKLANIRLDTGLSGLQIRLYAQLVDLDMPEQQWDDLAAAAAEPLHPDRLRHLYNDLELPLNDIARLCLTSERIVRDALTAAGVTLLTRRPRRLRVTREWFQDNYLHTADSLTQVAARTGHSRETLRKNARELGIPTGHDRTYNPFAAWPPDRLPPPNVVAACSGRNGLTYLRQVLTILAHPTRRAAADSLGITETALWKRRHHIERRAGLRILEPKTRPTPTPEGAIFIREATLALHRLDGTDERS